MPSEPPKAQPVQPRSGAPAPVARGPEPARPSRLKKMLSEDIDPPLPSLTAAGHLVGYLFEAGPVAQTGFGLTTVSWAELQAWQHQTGVELDAWEARTVRALSGEYAAESRRAEAHDALSPMTIVSTEKIRASVSKRISMEFGAMAAAQRHQARVQL